jgi:hypothetical protein
VSWSDSVTSRNWSWIVFSATETLQELTVTEPGMVDFKVNCSVPEFPMEEVNLEQ